MTTIIASKHAILADEKLSGDGYGGPERAVKVCRLNDGSLLGGAGTFGHLNALAAYLNGELESLTYSDVCGAVNECAAVQVREDGTMHYYDHGPLPYQVEDLIVFMGSGAPFAKAAVYLGHSLEEAMECAAVLDEGTGAECAIYPFKDAPDEPGVVVPFKGKDDEE